MLNLNLFGEEREREMKKLHTDPQLMSFWINKEWFILLYLLGSLNTKMPSWRCVNSLTWCKSIVYQNLFVSAFNRDYLGSHWTTHVSLHSDITLEDMHSSCSIYYLNSFYLDTISWRKSYDSRNVECTKEAEVKTCNGEVKLLNLPLVWNLITLVFELNLPFLSESCLEAFI